MAVKFHFLTQILFASDLLKCASAQNVYLLIKFLRENG